MPGDSISKTASLNHQSRTYTFLIDDAKALLYDCCDTPRIDAEILIQHVVKKDLSWLICYGDSIASAEHVKHFYQLVEQRQQGHPVAYILGERDFWSLTLNVNENVLIPRPDTETLIEIALPLVPNSDTSHILDLGTGSGAIALSLAKERPNSIVTAVDYHQKALEVAEQNAKRNNINNVNFVQSNWFQSLNPISRFDLIASNPPYIESNDPHLAQGDLRFEPPSALIAKKNGLADLALIIESAPNYLKPQGWLIVEHGYNQADAVAQLFNEHGFSKVRLFHDLNNLARCTLGQIC